MMTRLLLLLAAMLSLTACVPHLKGPPTSLEEIAAPDPVTPVVFVAPPPPVPPAPPALPRPLGPGRWRAWIPRQSQPNGDVIEGHYVELSPTAPAVHILEPVKPMPRAPKVNVSVKRSALPKQVPVPMPAEGLPPGESYEYAPPASPQGFVPLGHGTGGSATRGTMPRWPVGGP